MLLIVSTSERSGISLELLEIKVELQLLVPDTCLSKTIFDNSQKPNKLRSYS